MEPVSNTYKTRLLYEYKELLKRITRLKCFIDLNNKMDETDYKLLVAQLEAMEQYLSVLEARIEKELNK